MASWSHVNPRLQLVWDASSLKVLEKCPTRYLYSVVEGWRRPDNPHLDFGSLFQEAIEWFQLARLRGNSVHEATLVMLRHAIQISGRYNEIEGGYDWRPWGGEYRHEWRCTGTTPFKNERGNRAKCPRSHAGKWFEIGTEMGVWQMHPEDGGEYCALCDSPIERRLHYTPDHPSKHRLNLVRALLLFASGQRETGGLQPYAFPDGTPAVEINVTVPIGFKSKRHRRPDGSYTPREDFMVAINLDEINTWRSRFYPTDNKTSKNPLNTNYWKQFSPNTQMDLYDLMTTVALPDLDYGGIAVRATQVTKENVDTRTRLITKTEGQRQEMWRDLHYWIGQAERFAAEGRWPRNRSDCGMCDFNGVCDSDEEFRQQHLEAEFVKRGPWDPIIRPGRTQEEDDDDSTAI